MRKILVAIAFFVAFPLLHAQQTLNNDSVIKMFKMGFQEDMIVAQINRSPGTYDTSPTALTVLKNAGVGDQAVAAMLLKVTAPAQPAAPAQMPLGSKASNPPPPPGVVAASVAPIATPSVISGSRRLYIEEALKTTSGSSSHCDPGTRPLETGRGFQLCPLR